MIGLTIVVEPWLIRARSRLACAAVTFAWATRKSAWACSRLTVPVSFLLISSCRRAAALWVRFRLRGACLCGRNLGTVLVRLNGELLIAGVGHLAGGESQFRDKALNPDLNFDGFDGLDGRGDAAGRLDRQAL